MFRQKKTFSKKKFFLKLKNIQKKLKRMFNAFLQSSILIALILKAQKDLTTKIFFFEKMFRLLFKKLKCRIRSKIIKKCKLSFLSFLISNIFSWHIDDLYCDIFANESRFIQRLKIRRTNNFVRLMMFQSEKSLLIDEHDHFCELFQILFTDEFKIVIERIVKFDQYINQKMTNLKRNHTIFLQSLKKWTIKQIVWKYTTVLNWYTSSFKNYLWSFESKKTYNLFDEWKFVVTERQTHFRKSLSIIDEFFKSIDRFFSSQRQLQSFEYSLNKNKNLHMLKNQFVQMTIHFWRSTERHKNENVFKSISSQKFFQIDSKFQFAFKTIIQQKSFQSESISEFHSKSIQLIQFAFVSEIRLIFHRSFHSIQFFFNAQLTAFDVCLLIEIDRHGFISSIQFAFIFEVRLMFHKNSSHSFQFQFGAQSIVSISDKSKSIFYFSKIDFQLTLNYLSNRRHKLRRENVRFSFAYSLLSADFVFETFELSLFYENNILNMKFNATNLNLNSNDSNDVVKLMQTRLYSTINFINSSTRFIIQMISIKKTQNSFESDNFKRSRSENVHSEFIEKKFFKWKFEYYIESFETDYSFYFDKLKEKSKKNEKTITQKRVLFLLLMTFVKNHLLLIFFTEKSLLWKYVFFETLYLVPFLSNHWPDYICPFGDSVANHQFYILHKRTPVSSETSVDQFRKFFDFQKSVRTKKYFIASHYYATNHSAQYAFWNSFNQQHQ